MSLTFASAFAGIGGFDLGFSNAGMSCSYQIEWMADRQRVLAQHFPTTPRGGDIRDIDAADIGRPDVLVGGFPCQDTSIGAPHRAGLAGTRSGLFWSFQRLLGEHLRLVDASRPRWTVIENPDGLLKSNDGRDMAAVVSGLEELGYGWAYRVVDSGHLGSAQRRRRVLLVGCRGYDAAAAWSVLGDREAGFGSGGPSASRTKRGPAPVVGDQVPGALIFRKSARPRASLAKGGYETWVPAEFTNTLTGFDGGLPTRQTHLIVQGDGVRTLTATEWERLQGFPDDWTSSMTASARWSAIGDSMNVRLAEWLGHRLIAADATLPTMIGAR